MNSRIVPTREKEYQRLREAGWAMAEDYPAAGKTIMVRDGRIVTVMKNGKIKIGAHRPKN